MIGASSKTSSAATAGKATDQTAQFFLVLRRLRTPLDALIIVVAAAAAARIEWHMILGNLQRVWQGGAAANNSLWRIFATFFGFAVLLLWISSRHPVSSLGKRSFLQEQKLNLRDCAISGLFLVGALYLVGAETLSRSFVLVFLALVACGLGLRRMIYRRFPTETVSTHNVLIIGSDSAACAFREQLRDGAGVGYVFKGFVKLSDSEPDCIADAAEVVGTIENLAEHVCKYSVNGVVLTASCSKEMTRRIVGQARELGVEARMIHGHLRLEVNRKNRARSRK
jgi:FlaA1/EpsC-like NDP-sugar epimerase